MLLDLFFEGCEEYFSSRYIGFQRFKCEILRGWNSELGVLYNNHYSYLWNNIENDISFGTVETIELFQRKKSFEIIEKIDKLLNEYDKPYNEGMKIFIYYSNSGSEITPDKCVLLLKSIERVDPNKFDNSSKDNFLWFRKSYIIWKKIIASAIEDNKNIILC